MNLSAARKFLATCLLLPPVLWAVSSLVGPSIGNSSSTTDQLKDLHKIAAHQGAYIASSVMLLVAAALFIIATYGIVHVYRGRKVGVGQIAGGLIALGMAVFFSFYAFAITEYEMTKHAAFRHPAQQLLFAHLTHFAQSGAPGAPLFIVLIVGTVVGPILLGAAMIRRRNVPLRAGILTIVTGPVGFFATGRVGNAVFQLILLVALAPLALLIWRMTDGDWDAPREIAGARRGQPPLTSDPAGPVPAPAV
jgi:hypothetical protein